MARRSDLIPAFVLASALAFAACTNNGPTVPGSTTVTTGPSPSSTPSAGPSLPVLNLGVVADLSARSSDRPYLDGMRLAVNQVNASGGVAGYRLGLSLRDDRDGVGRATNLLRAELGTATPALLYVGPGSAVTPLRPDLERTGTPLVLVGGDLYTSRGLFREVFQTSVPWVWQAHVIARYLVRDRRAARIAFVGFGPGAQTAASVTAANLEYWGGRLATSVVEPAGASVDGVAARFGGSDTVVLFGSPEDSERMVAALGTLPDPPRIAGSAALLDLPLGSLQAPPGTTACYTYTWAGWAEPIKRVARFRAGFERFAGRPPSGLEQEGYDAIRTLAAALAKTGGKGGPSLVRALEAVHQTFSSFPVDLGPDDHTFMPRDELGLFAVAGTKERLDPWEQPRTEPWRALMRTFTYDGTRTNILDEDKRVFFPFWGKNQPGPEYWRSRYGIATRPTADRVH